MKDRLIQLRKNLGLTQRDLGKAVNLTDPMISLYESGRRIPNNLIIQLICTTFGVREEWLREGEGEMMDEEALLADWETRLLEQFRRLSPRAQELLIEYVEKLLSDERALRGEAPSEKEQVADTGKARKGA